MEETFPRECEITIGRRRLTGKTTTQRDLSYDAQCGLLRAEFIVNESQTALRGFVKLLLVQSQVKSFLFPDPGSGSCSLKCLFSFEFAEQLVGARLRTKA